MKENKYQKEIVDWFSQEFPAHYGHFFHVNNSGFTAAQRNYLNSMGQIPGVADLLFYSIIDATLSAVEVKAPGSRHDKKRIKTQLEWGKELYNSGGCYFIGSDKVLIKSYLTMLATGDHKGARILSKENITTIRQRLSSPGQHVTF